MLSSTFQPLFQEEIRILIEDNYQGQEAKVSKTCVRGKKIYVTCRFIKGKGLEREETRRQILQSLWSPETRKMLWEFHFLLRDIIISHRQSAIVSALIFQQFANPHNIMEYALPILMLLFWDVAEHVCNSLWREGLPSAQKGSKH